MYKAREMVPLLISIAALAAAISIGRGKIDENPMPVLDTTDELKLVAEEFNKIESLEDKVLIHKLFAGGGDYLDNCETMVNTSQFGPLLGKVQTSYGWEREKYSEFTDAVSDYLVSVKYDIPKDLTTKQERQDFAKIFKDLAEATKYE